MVEIGVRVSGPEQNETAGGPPQQDLQPDAHRTVTGRGRDDAPHDMARSLYRDRKDSQQGVITQTNEVGEIEHELQRHE